MNQTIRPAVHHHGDRDGDRGMDALTMACCEAVVDGNFERARISAVAGAIDIFERGIVRDIRDWHANDLIYFYIVALSVAAFC